MMVLVYLAPFAARVDTAHCCSHDSPSGPVHHDHDHDNAVEHHVVKNHASDGSCSTEDLTWDHPHCCGMGHRMEGSRQEPSVVRSANGFGRLSLSSVSCQGALELDHFSSGVTSSIRPARNSHPPPSSISLQSLLTIFLLI